MIFLYHNYDALIDQQNSIYITIIGLISTLLIIVIGWNIWGIKKYIKKKIKITAKRSEGIGNYCLATSYLNLKGFEKSKELAELARGQFMEIDDKIMVENCQYIINICNNHL